MSWDDKHPCPNCGKMHEEREQLKKCTRCGQVYCGDYNCDHGSCPKCGNGGVVLVTWNSIYNKWS